MEDCLFSLNIPLQILPSAWSYSLLQSPLSPSQSLAWLTLNSKIPLPSPSHCRHTLYQSITDTVNTSVSQYYLVIPRYYHIYRNNIQEISLLFVRLVTYFSCYHPQHHSNATPDISYKAMCPSSEDLTQESEVRHVKLNYQAFPSLGRTGMLEIVRSILALR